MLRGSEMQEALSIEQFFLRNSSVKACWAAPSAVQLIPVSRATVASPKMILTSKCEFSQTRDDEMTVNVHKHSQQSLF